MRHTFLYKLYAAVPILASVVFLMYYRFNGWSEASQISGYMQIIGIALPFLVSVLCAGNIGLEEQNHFQVLLGSHTRRWRGLEAKWLTLAGAGFLAIAAAVLLFAAGYRLGLGKEGIGAGDYMLLVLLLFWGSVPLYLEHLFFNLVFARSVSQCIGVMQSLIAAVFLTGLGEGRWQFFPCTWSARGAALYLCGMGQDKVGEAALAQLRYGAVTEVLLFLFFYVIIRVWFHYYEGRHCND